MDKTSTLFFSIHGLGSKIQNNIYAVDDLEGKLEFADVYQSLDKLPLADVKQEVVDRILSEIDNL